MIKHCLWIATTYTYGTCLPFWQPTPSYPNSIIFRPCVCYLSSEAVFSAIWAQTPDIFPRNQNTENPGFNYYDLVSGPPRSFLLHRRGRNARACIIVWICVWNNKTKKKPDKQDTIVAGGEHSKKKQTVADLSGWSGRNRWRCVNKATTKDATSVWKGYTKHMLLYWSMFVVWLWFWSSLYFAVNGFGLLVIAFDWNVFRWWFDADNKRITRVCQQEATKKFSIRRRRHCGIEWVLSFGAWWEDNCYYGLLMDTKCSNCLQIISTTE